jgi:hypothetical protein
LDDPETVDTGNPGADDSATPIVDMGPFEFEPLQPCTGDVSPDGFVDVDDLLLMINQWGPCKGQCVDLTGDGVVDELDLEIVIKAWGACP